MTGINMNGILVAGTIGVVIMMTNERKQRKTIDQDSIEFINENVSEILALRARNVVIYNSIFNASLRISAKSVVIAGRNKFRKLTIDSPKISISGNNEVCGEIVYKGNPNKTVKSISGTLKKIKCD